MLQARAYRVLLFINKIQLLAQSSVKIFLTEATSYCPYFSFYSFLNNRNILVELMEKMFSIYVNFFFISIYFTQKEVLNENF